MIHFRRCNTRFWFWTKTKRWTNFGQFEKFSSTAPSSCKNCEGLRILYFGSDAFSIGPLAKLISRMRQIPVGKLLIGDIEVVTSEPPLLEKAKKKQQTSEFIKFVKNEKLHIHPWNKEVLNKLPTFDIGVVASFGYLIPRKTIQSFKRGIINAHPSLLPRWHGAAPIIHTILNGDVRTGVTIIGLSVGRFDKGKIFYQKEFDVEKTWTAEILTDSLSNLAGKMVLDVIDDYDYYDAKAQPQPEEGGTHAPKISTALSYIKWHKQSSIEIDRLYRAIGNKVGLHTFFEDKLVKLVTIKLLDKENCDEIDEQISVPYEAGRSWYDKKTKQLFIKSIDGWIEAVSLQMQYKKPVKPTDFYNAYMVDRQKTGKTKDLFHSSLQEKL